SEDDAARGEDVGDAFRPDGADAGDAAFGGDDEVDGAGFVGDDAADAFEAAVEQVDEALAAGGGAATIAGGVRVALLPFEAHVCEPFGGFAGVLAEGADEVRVGATAGDAHEIFEH